MDCKQKYFTMAWPYLGFPPVTHFQGETGSSIEENLIKIFLDKNISISDIGKIQSSVELKYVEPKWNYFQQSNTKT